MKEGRISENYENALQKLNFLQRKYLKLIMPNRASVEHSRFTFWLARSTSVRDLQAKSCFGCYSTHPPQGKAKVMML